MIGASFAKPRFLVRASGCNAGDNLLIKNTLERAVLVGGEEFALGLKKAFVASVKSAEANAQGFAGRGGPAAYTMAQMTAMDNPADRFKFRSKKNEFLYRQATSDCYILTVSAFVRDPDSGQRGVMAWRTRVSVRAERIPQLRAYSMMIAKAAPFYGVAMTEPAMSKRHSKAASKAKSDQPKAK